MKMSNVYLSIEKSLVMRIKELKDLIVHVHVHDNDGLNDLHLPPTFGKINFIKIFNALKEINYNGQIIVEAVDISSPEPSDSFVENSLKIVRKLISTS